MGTTEHGKGVSIGHQLATIHAMDEIVEKLKRTVGDEERHGFMGAYALAMFQQSHKLMTQSGYTYVEILDILQTAQEREMGAARLGQDLGVQTRDLQEPRL